jgi:hypothetical protein
MLNGLAQAMQTVELQIARFFFAWQTRRRRPPRPRSKAGKVDHLPARVLHKDLLEELEIWAEAIALDLGLTFTQRIKLRAAKSSTRTWTATLKTGRRGDQGAEAGPDAGGLRPAACANAPPGG